VVVGGLGTVAGAVLGALFVVFVPQYASDVSQALTGLIYGATLIAVMYLLPGGAAGLLRRLRRLVVEVVEPTVPAHRGGTDAVPTSDPAPAGSPGAGRGGLRP
jgi:branched-chain amino acid transport system permease protein